MAEWIGGSGLAPSLAIIGEPSKLRLIDGHKGGLIGWCNVTGKPGHSSQPDRYVNAVMAAGDMIAFINKLRAEMRAGLGRRFRSAVEHDPGQRDHGRPAR